MAIDSKYRPDIDGLRAIAVLSVVLFHFKLGPFQGGFVGVDIFYVISGFLIAGIIRDELAKGTFTLAGFYERRIRRILPALSVVMLATAAAGAMVLLPSDLRRLGYSTMATALFGSNLYFWRNTGYFASGQDFNPLLHTWSLAVEEQYYLFFPVFLYLLTRFRRSPVGAVIAGVGLVSFAFCVFLQRYRPEVVFYLLPFRMWELLAGAWLAVARVPIVQAPAIREWLAATGLFLIGASVLLIPPGSNFPGWIAAAPVVGTVLVIHAGSSGPSLVSRFLSIRGLVGVGLISYSLYLWHWPAAVLTRYRQGAEVGVGRSLVLLAVVLVLSYLTYRFVEKPLRRRRGGPSSARRVFATAATAILCGVTLGVVLSLNQGWDQRFDQRVDVLDRDRDATIPFLACNDRRKFYEASSDLVDLNRLCRIGKEGGIPTAVLWGDSHALAWAPAIDAAFRQRGITGVLAVGAECPPLHGLIDRLNGRCGAFNEQVRLQVNSNSQLRLVVLAAAWPSYAAPADSSRLMDRLAPGDDWDFARVFERTVDELVRGGKRVWTLGPTPRAPDDPAFSVAIASAYDFPVPLPASTGAVRASAQSFWNAVSQVSPRNGVVFSDPINWLCDISVCRYTHDGRVLYRDAGHLNVRGAMYLLPNVLSELTKVTGGLGEADTASLVSSPGE